MTLTEILIVAATLLGPITAVQSQKWIERAGENRRRKRHIFYTLMATRGTRLAGDHVQALNTIELEFRGNRYRAVVEAWRVYADVLGDPAAGADPAALYARRDDLFVGLLGAMSAALGYNFDRIQLKRGAYTPQGHVDDYQAQQSIQRGLVELLGGKSALAMRVTDFPSSPELVQAQIDMMKKSANAYSDDGRLRVTMDTPARKK